MLNRTVVAFVLSVCVVGAQAAGKSGADGGGHLYRYVNDNGVQVIENSISPEYARKGYQIITRSGQVVKEVPAASMDGSGDPEADKARREREALMARRDVELRKMYSSPQDAERHRDRQLDALKLKADFARGQLSQVTSKRTAELEAAAGQERRGRAVAPEQREMLERYNRQIADLEAQVGEVEKEQQQLRDDYEPIIERLGVIYPGKTRPAAAPADSAPSAPPAAAQP